MFERFTVAARGVVIRARQEAQQLRHPHVGTEHLLLAMLAEEAGLPYAILHEAGLEAAQVRAEIERLVGQPPKILSDDDAEALRTIGIDLDAVLAKVEQLRPEEPPLPTGRGRRRIFDTGARFSPRAKKVIELSLREAIALRHGYIGAEHILLGLIREGNGLAAKILADAGVPLAGLRKVTLLALDAAA